MSVSLNRRDIGYTIISRFEEAFRCFLAQELESHFSDYLQGVPTGILDKAKDRASDHELDAPLDFLEYTDFPDLREIVCYNSMYKAYFPNADLSKREFTTVMDDLYESRCKIAHIRRYFTSFDLDRLLENVQSVAPNLGEWEQDFSSFIQNLQDDPQNVVMPIPVNFFTDEPPPSIPNNIPIPDYEYEGGFVGRKEDIRKVIGLLSSRRDVITISGAGGVGKSALALRVIQKVLKGSEMSFDGIVWLSAKESRLSYLGIEDIEPTLKNYEELLDAIFEVMGFGDPRDSIEQKEADVKTIFELHDSILIVIDNLETITDDRIIDFILDPYPNVKILITSRRGLGQVERRHELKQLKEKEAIYLFRQIARDKGIRGLISLDDRIVGHYVRKVSCYPLSIKWIIGQVAIGKDINNVIDEISETTSDISRFCFDQIYETLSPQAKTILGALSAFDDSPSAGILNYVCNLSKEDLEDGLRDLVLVSFVIPEPCKGGDQKISTRYSLLPLTRGYVRKQMDNEPVLRMEIIERLQKVRSTVEEAERARKQYKYSLANLGATTEEEKVATMIAQTAFQKYQAGRYPEAVEDYQRAVQIAPKFASLYRNWAVMESQEQHHVEADKLMGRAAKLNPTDTQIWLTWGNMKRKQGKIKDSVEKCKKAYELSPEDSIVLNALGQAQSRSGNYVEADNLFKNALRKVIGDSVQNEIINRSSIAHNLSRWAEADRDDRKYETAKEKLEEALQQCDVTVALDKTDQRSKDLRRKILINLGFLHIQMGDHSLAVNYFIKAIVKKSPRGMRYREAKDTVTAATQAGRILYFQFGEIEKAKEVFQRNLVSIRDPIRSSRSLREKFQELRYEIYEKQHGIVNRVEPDRGFCIIQSTECIEDTYLGHINDFEAQLNRLSQSLKGSMVSFILNEEVDKQKAMSIRIIESKNKAGPLTTA